MTQRDQYRRRQLKSTEETKQTSQSKLIAPKEQQKIKGKRIEQTGKNTKKEMLIKERTRKYISIEQQSTTQDKRRNKEKGTKAKLKIRNRIEEERVQQNGQAQKRRDKRKG